ncbi:hypothetical protein HG536_0A08370 [Torulaspora globosa]|uniref:C-CAP/cofactor C-like domain-containing protein n=1 Tax=Torulaspora globosa TaxID=48254 RepID=A0A7G3ZBY6_9SACH|nr:uncharacterized protein HG536_0A08370 [Torulaspora globosa]QLL31022.1 hypothetical protein HG536_0A08370 [Torulaspora globosa]
MIDQTVLDFERKCKDLQDAIEKGGDYDQLKKTCNELFKRLHGIASQLPPYDRERFHSKVDSLLDTISARESSKDATRNSFRFQKKPSVKNKKATMNAADMPFHTKIETMATRVGELITIKSSTASYENLNKCTLISEVDAAGHQSGSLILRNINNSTVKLEPAPFSSGSILITDCENLLITCSTPPKNAIQMRLHNLSNCKLLIRPLDSATKQVIVLENCFDCIFHKTTEHLLNLQNFSALALRGKDDNVEDTDASKFELFDITGSTHQ